MKNVDKVTIEDKLDSNNLVQAIARSSFTNKTFSVLSERSKIVGDYALVVIQKPETRSLYLVDLNRIEDKNYAALKIDSSFHLKMEDAHIHRNNVYITYFNGLYKDKRNYLMGEKQPDVMRRVSNQ